MTLPTITTMPDFPPRDDVPTFRAEIGTWGAALVTLTTEVQAFAAAMNVLAAAGDWDPSGTGLIAWDSGDTAIDALMAGSQSGALLEGPVSAHFSIGIRGNDSGDAFSILGYDGAGGSTYTQNLFNVSLSKAVTFGNGVSIASNGAITAPSTVKGTTITAESAAPVLKLSETGTDTGYSVTWFVQDGNGLSQQTRTSGDVFVSSDYSLARNASGATTHTWRIANADRFRVVDGGPEVYRDGAWRKVAFTQTITVADNAVAAFTPPRTGGFVDFTVAGETLFPQLQHFASFRFDVGTSPTASPITEGSNATVTTGVLTGTTGLDGDITYSAQDDGTILVENRGGAPYSIRAIYRGDG